MLGFEHHKIKKKRILKMTEINNIEQQQIEQQQIEQQRQPQDERTYSIGEVIARLQQDGYYMVYGEQLRRWQRAGLFELGRSEGGQRVIRIEDMELIRFVAGLIGNGVRIKQVRQIVSNNGDEIIRAIEQVEHNIEISRDLLSELRGRMKVLKSGGGLAMEG